MAKVIKNTLGNFLVILVIFTLVTGWFYSGWPQILKNPSIPPEIKEVHAADKVIFLTSGSSWTVPADWTNVNTIEAWGAGGVGYAGTTGTATQGRPGGAGGGGGAYAYITNFNPGAGPIPYVIGQGGTTGVSPTDTTWNTNTIVAKAGTNATSQTLNGTGGLASACTPTSGAQNGGDGGDGAARSGAAGGGGGGGGGAGGTTGVGGAGSNGTAGSNGGAGGAGGATSGGTAGSANSGSGGAGTVRTQTDSPFASAGAGGGGGGGLGGNSAIGGDGGPAGAYGAGGGGGGGGGAGTKAGGSGAAGQNGIIIITYTPLVVSVSITRTDAQGTISYGNVDLSSSTSTDPAGQNKTTTFQNNGNVAEKFSIKTGNAVNGTGWTAVSGTPGANQFRHSFATTSPVTYWKVMGIDPSYEIASSSVAVSGTLDIYLKLETPSASDYVTKDISVTVFAEQAP